MTNRVDMFYGQNWVEQLRRYRASESLSPLTRLMIGTTCAESLRHIRWMRPNSPTIFQTRATRFENLNEDNYVLVR